MKNSILLENLCNACYQLDYKRVKEILKDPLSKTIINQSWVNKDSYN